MSPWNCYGTPELDGETVAVAVNDGVVALRDDGDVQHSIKKALERAAEAGTGNITVEIIDGTATLSGTVGSGTSATPPPLPRGPPLFSIVYGISTLILSFQTHRAGTAASRLTYATP